MNDICCDMDAITWMRNFCFHQSTHHLSHHFLCLDRISPVHHKAIQPEKSIRTAGIGSVRSDRKKRRTLMTFNGMKSDNLLCASFSVLFESSLAAL
jgi:hypothetical protein